MHTMCTNILVHTHSHKYLDKDAAAVREQLEKDLEAAKAQLKARRASETTEQGGDQEAGEVGGKKSSTEIEVCVQLQFNINSCINFHGWMSTYPI